MLQFQRDQHLRQFAFDGLLRAEEEATRDLHGQRGPALLVTPAAHIHQRRFHQPVVVDPGVLEETAIFDGQHRIHHDLGDLVEANQAPLGPLLIVGERGDQLRLQFVGRQFVVLVVGGGNFFHLPFADADYRTFGAVVGGRPRPDLDPPP